MAWWDGFFDATYRAFWEGRTGPEQTRADVEGIARLLVEHGLDAGELRLVDLACGDGRIACGLARLGHEVVGVDLSADQLAAASARATRERVEVALERADMRQIPPVLAGADAVVLWFSSFGYFAEAADDLRVLEAVRRTLRPGGLLLLDVQHRDRIARGGARREWLDADGGTLLREAVFDPLAGRVEERLRFLLADGRSEERTFSIRIYTATELLALTRAAGLEVVGIHGGAGGEPFDLESRLVLVARRPG